jgi:hypothetical protein
MFRTVKRRYIHDFIVGNVDGKRWAPREGPTDKLRDIGVGFWGRILSGFGQVLSKRLYFRGKAFEKPGVL